MEELGYRRLFRQLFLSKIQDERALEWTTIEEITAQLEDMEAQGQILEIRVKKYDGTEVGFQRAHAADGSEDGYTVEVHPSLREEK